jgi:hypothetical protein
MREGMGEQEFAQEIEARFVTWTGSVFTRLREAIVDAPEGRAAVIGVDWAGASGSGDYTAFVTISASGHVLEVARLRGEPFSLQRARLKALWERHAKPPVLAEQNGMGAVQNAELRASGVPVQDWLTTHASKTEIIAQLVVAIEQANLRILNDQVLLDELQVFQCVPLAGGQFRYSAPAGLHDDCVMALAIAWRGMGSARKHAQLQAIDWSGVNQSLATGSAYRTETTAGEAGEAGEWVRVLRQRWTH